jgi:pimeloyl-ACP methyl ester carboxylesterase
MTAIALARTSSAPAARRDGPGFIRAAEDVNLFYRDWGSGAPVVFLAGWSMPSESWTYQMLALCERGFRCIGFDRRGHGRSSEGAAYDFDTLADDLAAVLEALGLSDVTLVGHSMASGEIVRYLTRHGSARVSRIALLGPVTPFLVRTGDNPDGIDPAVFESFRRDWLMRDLPGWIEANIRPFVLPETSVQTMDWLRGLCLQASAKALLECSRAQSATDFRPELPAITVPTLVIHGDRDVSAPLDLTGRRTAVLIPGAKLKVYEGAPHGLFITHAERLNADLLEFVWETS